jgi:hypothetical protein
MSKSNNIGSCTVTPETRNSGMKAAPSRQKNKTKARLLFKTVHICLCGMNLRPVLQLSGIQTLTDLLPYLNSGIPTPGTGGNMRI